jgi:endoglucanase
MKRIVLLAALLSSAITTPSGAATDRLPVGRCVNMGNSLETPFEGA